MSENEQANADYRKWVAQLSTYPESKKRGDLLSRLEFRAWQPKTKRQPKPLPGQLELFS